MRLLRALAPRTICEGLAWCVVGALSAVGIFSALPPLAAAAVLLCCLVGGWKLNELVGLGAADDEEEA